MIIHFTLVISIKQRIRSDLGLLQSKLVEKSKSGFKAEFTCGRSSLMVKLIDILLVFGYYCCCCCCCCCCCSQQSFWPLIFLQLSLLLEFHGRPRLGLVAGARGAPAAEATGGYLAVDFPLLVVDLPIIYRMYRGYHPYIKG